MAQWQSTTLVRLGHEFDSHHGHQPFLFLVKLLIFTVFYESEGKPTLSTSIKNPSGLYRKVLDLQYLSVKSSELTINLFKSGIIVK